MNASVIVGTASDIATEFEAWGDAGAVDGFNVLSAIQPAQFDAFARSAWCPELQRRGVFPTEYEGETLRDSLGLARPDNVHVAAAGCASASASAPLLAHAPRRRIAPRDAA